MLWLCKQGVTTLWNISLKYPFLRKLTAMVAKYGVDLMFMENAGVLQVDLDGNPIAYYHDPKLSHIATCDKIGKYLYCGSLSQSHILRLDLLKYPAQNKKLWNIMFSQIRKVSILGRSIHCHKKCKLISWEWMMIVSLFFFFFCLSRRFVSLIPKAYTI